MDPLCNKFCMFLNTDDMYDPELAMVKNRLVRGTLALWFASLDPYVTIHQPSTSSHTALILAMPGYTVSIHVVIYLPTSGRECDFISELACLKICLTELADQYPGSPLYIRGDCNVNKNNKNRTIIFQQFLDSLCLLRVDIQHNTYHHFTGEGLYDSEIDVILFQDFPGVLEHVTK